MSSRHRIRVVYRGMCSEPYEKHAQHEVPNDYRSGSQDVDFDPQQL